MANINRSTVIISDLLLSNEMTSICQWIIFSIICQAIDIFGIGTNIINIVCFVGQGFKDPVNISLLGLAVADIGCLSTLIWTNICNTPAFSSLDLPFDTLEFQYLTSGMLHLTFTRITAWITAIITLERCLCITLPLKVKTIVTPRRISSLIIAIFTVLLLSVAPLYAVNRLGLKYFPQRNKSLIGILFTKDREYVEQISFGINNVFIPFGAFLVVNVCTVILVFKIKQRSKWRHKSTTAVQADNISSRNWKVAKMVIMLSTLFITCFMPVSITFMAMISVPGLSVAGTHQNILIVIAGICFVLVSTNSSANIFIYYHMSSKFRFYFRELFRLPKDENSRLD